MARLAHHRPPAPAESPGGGGCAAPPGGSTVVRWQTTTHRSRPPSRVPGRRPPGAGPSPPSAPTWPALLDAAPESEGIDLAAVRAHRLGRVRQQMADAGIDALILSDAVNVRYATGSRNMQVFTSRNAPSRYLVLTADRSVLHEFTGCEHLAEGLETIDEVRPALTASFVAAGPPTSPSGSGDGPRGPAPCWPSCWAPAPGRSGSSASTPAPPWPWPGPGIGWSTPSSRWSWPGPSSRRARWTASGPRSA